MYNIFKSVYNGLKYLLIFNIVLLITACSNNGGYGNTEPSNLNAITSYSISSPRGPVSGVISGTHITVTMPYGTNVTALTATFATNGKFVTINGSLQTSGQTANNFTNPVRYTVTAANGTIQNYTVTVVIAPNTSKDIVAYSLNGNTGVITGTNIAVTVPFGTDVTALIATFSTSGESISIGSTIQTSTLTPNDFTNPVTYTVHAADGSTKDYIVTVTVASNSAKNIETFSLNGYAGVITGTNIAVTVPFGTDVTALIATFSTSGESVSIGSTIQTSTVTPNDFTNPVTYTVHAADRSTKNYIVTVTTQPPQWFSVGSAGFSAGSTNYSSIAFNLSNNQPYVAYRDNSQNSKVTVMAFNGISWENVGNAGFSAGQSDWVDLAFNPSTNQPYVVYSDAANSNKATVMKFDSAGNWITVGSSRFSTGVVSDISITFNHSNYQPYVVYVDRENSNKATVMTFNGTDWVNVGNAGFSAGSISTPSIVFNPSNNQPYVAYRDDINSNKATVMTFNGTNWVNVGNAGFSAGQSEYQCIAFDPSTNLPYVAYKDGANSNKVTVMKFPL
ncbi:hypothetical protein [Aquella oligotrophica]|uniref:DUF5018 domain-containing protein n=1 Tax=Aquella oligotrophica TaxID=2067065 RepID=A0A2I7N5R5_9NEIS|nr:hypothetical protein [Aquella oligotrophica]AUR51782.1 hypothetical protein CUN60_05565 [Aquella oligotrophica]